jgi:hypothetical protein
VSKKFCLSDVLGSSQSRHDEGHHAVETVAERPPRIISFDNLGEDSTPDIREASLPKRIADVPAPPPPLSHSELPSNTFANLLKILMHMFSRWHYSLRAFRGCRWRSSAVPATCRCLAIFFCED